MDLFCFLCFVFVMLSCRIYLLQSCGHLLGKGWPLGSLICGDLLCFITSQWGVLGQMWYLSVSVADLCILSYLKERKQNNFVFQTVTQELLLGSYA